MDIEPEEEIVAEDSIRGDLEKAFADVEVPAEPQEDKPAEKPVDTRTRDESGKFAKTSTPAIETEKIPDAPRSWTAEEKAKWNEATPEVRKAILRREQEVELGFTKLDEDRNLGKSMKEAITPYLPIITAEGGTPVTAVKELLNTAYVLRTAPIAQKTALFHQLAKQYGVDLSQPNNTQGVQPSALLAEIQQLKQQIAEQPDVFRKQQENLAIKSQIDAFSADPKNIHYEKLKPAMAALLQGWQAKDMQEAYDKASWLDPEIRSAMQSDQLKASEGQRIADIKAKATKARTTAISVKGSPGINPVPLGKSNGSIADDLREAWDLHA